MIYFEMTNDILIQKRENCFGYAGNDLLIDFNLYACMSL